MSQYQARHRRQRSSDPRQGFFLLQVVLVVLMITARTSRTRRRRG